MMSSLPVAHFFDFFFLSWHISVYRVRRGVLVLYDHVLLPPWLLTAILFSFSFPLLLLYLFIFKIPRFLWFLPYFVFLVFIYFPSLTLSIWNPLDRYQLLHLTGRAMQRRVQGISKSSHYEKKYLMRNMYIEDRNLPPITSEVYKIYLS